MNITIKAIFSNLPEPKQHFVFNSNLQARLFANMLDKNENVVNWNVISHNLRNIGWTQHAWVKNVNTR